MTRLNFTLNESEMVYVKGPSGEGKSTFLKLLNRLIEPTHGRLELCGKPYAALDPMELRRKVQLVPQTPFLFPATVMENLKKALPSADNNRIIRLMEMFNLPAGMLENNGRQLSVGQAARICVIRSLLLEPEVILLDEPTAALDPENKEVFHSSFDEIRRELNIATVWVSHDPERSGKKAGRHITLKDGVFSDD